MLMRATLDPGPGCRRIGHGWKEFRGQLVVAKQLRQPSPIVIEAAQLADDHTFDLTLLEMFRLNCRFQLHFSTPCYWRPFPPPYSKPPINSQKFPRRSTSLRAHPMSSACVEYKHC